MDVYSLGPKGAKRQPRLMEAHGGLANRTYETFVNLNKKSLKKIIGGIYAGCPQYAKNGTKGEVTDVGSEDGACFNPEIERMVEEIESGNAGWSTDSTRTHRMRQAPSERAVSSSVVKRKLEKQTKRSARSVSAI